LGGRFLGPAIELALVLVLTLLNPHYINEHTTQLRSLALSLAAAISFFNIYAVVRLVHELLTGRWTDGPETLLLTGGSMWITNVIVFGLWYWEHDLGGPASRALALRVHPSFLFPQMTAPEITPRDWQPRFVDYLYLSFTNASAFSPTDVLPLARWAKLTMMVQATVSLVTLAMVIARAINTLA